MSKKEGTPLKEIAGMLNREGWLTELAKQVAPLFKAFALGPHRLTCGWPSRNATGTRALRLGECHGPQGSKGGVFEIFISPLIDQSIPVAGTVVHELAHVAAGIEAAHGRRYVKVCNFVGLTSGPPSQAMPGPPLEDRLRKIVDALGEYPHQGIKLVKKEKKPSSSMRLECPKCGCRVTMSFKWLEMAGPPTCACGGEME